jgi:hypothetical protein
MSLQSLAALETARAYWVGKRVALPPWTTRWAMGDRYGAVTAVQRARSPKAARPADPTMFVLTVRTDHGARQMLRPDDAEVVS